MFTWTEKSKANLVFAAAIFVMGWVAINTSKPANPWNRLITADGKGYYAYLPALFIYHDLSFDFIQEYEKKYYLPQNYSDFRVQTGEKKVNKYFSGTAILMAPAFFTAHIYSLIFGYPADGYSYIYELTLVFGALLYIGLGMFWLFLLLRGLGPGFWASLLAPLFVVFGSNIFHYATHEPAMSHTYSFTLMCGFSYFVWKWFHSPGRNDLLRIGILAGLIIAVRPSNAIILGILPFLAGSWPVLKGGILRAFTFPAHVICGIILLVLPLIIQSAFWYAQTGHWIVYSYGNEKFNFADPHILDILFSYRKGWFTWTPLAFIGITGLFLLLPKQPWRFVSAISFFLAVAYLLSSWWTWWYGMSFGHRAFIEFLFLPAIGLGLWLSFLSKHKVLKPLFFMLCIFLVLVNQVQGYQYRHYIILWDDTERGEFWKVFLRTGKEYEGLLWKKYDPKPIQIITCNTDSTFRNDFEIDGLWDDHLIRSKDESRSGAWGTFVDSEHHFSPSWRKTMDSASRDSFVTASVWFYADDRPLESILGLTMEKEGKVIYWQEAPLDTFYDPGRKWSQAVIKRELPRPLPDADKMQVYVWNRGKGETVYLDDMCVELYVRKK